jgi:LDH2 family malate/lactate/ureidoglycolate dehydrogenase
MTDPTVLSADDARAFAVEILRAIGMPGEDAAIAADAMVWAGLRGSITHSLIRLDLLARRARAGGLALTVDWTPECQRGNTTVIDARRAWGVVAGTHGMRHAVASANTHGTGLTSVRNCDNTSIMAWYSSLAVEAGMIGFAVNNGAPLMPAWGGAGRIIGNQAFSIASPSRRHPPVVIDMGIGALSLGDLNDALVTGSELPPDVAVNSAGEPTTDARDWRDGGALLPMGGHRGFGLALIWEALTGVLSGGSILTELHAPNEVEQPAGCSLVLMAIKPGTFIDPDNFVARVDRLIAQIHSSPLAPGADRVRIPGEDRRACTEQRIREGIPFPPDHVATLRVLADELGTRWPTSPIGG